MANLIWHGVSEFNAALDKAAKDAYLSGQRGANAAAALVARATMAKLARTTHARGEPTPSEAGDPPSLVTGQLRRSVKIIPAAPRGGSAWVAKVGPTAVYARIQELGGTTGALALRGTHTLPARPYLEPTVKELIDSGKLWTAFRSGYKVF